MKDDSKRKITFGNTDVGVTSPRIRRMLADPEQSKKLVEAIKECRNKLKKI